MFDHIDKFYSSKWFEDKLVINDVKLNKTTKGDNITCTRI